MGEKRSWAVALKMEESHKRMDPCPKNDLRLTGSNQTRALSLQHRETKL